jgi:hypothetical protein
VERILADGTAVQTGKRTQGDCTIPQTSGAPTRGLSCTEVQTGGEGTRGLFIHL